MDKNINIVLVIIVVFSLISYATSSALEIELSDDKRQSANYSITGLRLGACVFQSGEANLITDIQTVSEIPDVGFFTEMFYDYRLTKSLMAEISMGIASRGEVVITRFDDRYIGTINLYPLLLQLKFTPLSGQNLYFHPYIIAGGGFVFGRYNPQIIQSQDLFYDRYFTNKTEYDFVGVFGGGIDLAVSEQFGLNLSAKYIPVKFSNGMTGIEEYSGLSISLGFGYHLYKKGL